MPQEPTTRHIAAPAIVVALALMLLLLFVYIGALGPLARMEAQGRISRQTAAVLDRIYWPVVRIEKNCQPVQAALGWYMALWLPDQGPSLQ